MKRYISYNYYFFIVLILLLAACKNSGGNNEGSKTTETKKWTQDQRTEYMKDCIQSARQSYEARGQVGDSTTIVTVCKCAGEALEAKYGYTELSNVSKDTVKAIAERAAKDCLPTKQ